MTETLKIDFTRNWNGKLSCEAFGTVRLDNEKFQPGRRYAIWLKGALLGTAECVGVYRLTMAEVSDRIAWFDVGRPAAYLREVLIRMYANKGITWEKQQLAHVLLRWEQREPQWAELVAPVPPKTPAPAPPTDTVTQTPKPVAIQTTLGLPFTVRPGEQQRGFHNS